MRLKMLSTAAHETITDEFAFQAAREFPASCISSIRLPHILKAADSIHIVPRRHEHSGNAQNGEPGLE